MTKIFFKTAAHTLLAGAGLLATSSVFAQAVTGGEGAITTGVCQQSDDGLFTAIACGEGATTTATIRNPDGTTTTQTGNAAIAIGQRAVASALSSVAVGGDASANGPSGAAFGGSAQASGNRSTAIGVQARALGGGSVAIGAGSAAFFTSSVAIGSGSLAREENTVSFGAGQISGEGPVTRRLVNVSAGTLSTTSTDVVNGSQLFATNSRVSALEALNLNASNSIAGLQNGLNSLEDQLTLNNRQNNGGIAAAMALGGAVIVPDSNVSMSFNLSTYRGQQGFSGSVIGRVSEKVYVSGGFAGSTVKGSTGGRVGVTFGF
jgi:trimeric autotransporter adhesin